MDNPLSNPDPGQFANEQTEMRCPWTSCPHVPAEERPSQKISPGPNSWSLWTCLYLKIESYICNQDRDRSDASAAEGHQKLEEVRTEL